MIRPAVLSLVFLAACADEPPPPPAIASTPETGLILKIPGTAEDARALLEQVAVGCWLDGVVGGANMLVDRRTGRVQIVSDDADLLTADFAGVSDGKHRVRLWGPAVEDISTARQLARTLDRAIETGETICERRVG